MIARWRRESPDLFPTGWFVSYDKLTALAYERLPTDDAYPLTLSPESLVLLLSSTRTDSPDIGGLARALSHAVRRNSVLAVATTYSAAEAAHIAREIANGKEGLDGAELYQAVFEDFLKVYAPGREKRHIDELARVVAGKRARRSDSEGDRERQILSIENALEDDYGNEKLREKASTPDRERSDEGELQELREAQEGLLAELQRERSRREEMRRLAIAAPLVCATVVACLFLLIFGELSTSFTAAGILMTAITVILGIRYWRDRDASGWSIVSVFLIDALLVGAELILGQGVS